MAWSYVGKTTAAAAIVSPYTLSEPAGVVQGDLLVATIAYRSSDTVEFATPAGWTKINGVANANTLTTTAAVGSIGMWYCVRGASAPTYVFTKASGANAHLGSVVAYRGQATSNLLIAANIQTLGATATNVSVAGMTNTSANGDLHIIAFAGGQEAAWTFLGGNPAGGGPTNSGTTTDITAAPAFWVYQKRLDVNTTSGADTSLAVADAIIIPGTYAVNGTASLSALHAIMSVVIRAAPPTATEVVTAINSISSLSAGRQNIVRNLVNGLTTDGLWQKLKHLYVFANENLGQAGVNWRSPGLYGYGSTIDSFFVPNVGFDKTGTLTNTGNITITQGAAGYQLGFYGSWGYYGTFNTALTPSSGLQFFTSGVDTISSTSSGTSLLVRVANSSGTTSVASAISTGPAHFQMGRGLPSGTSSTVIVYKNGALLGTLAQAGNPTVSTYPTINFGNDASVKYHILYEFEDTFTPLTNTEANNLHIRLTTYLTEVGTIPAGPSVIAAMTAAGSTPSAGRQTLINSLANGLQTDGIWGKLQTLLIPAAEDLIQGKVEWKQKGNLTGTPTAGVFVANKGLDKTGAFINDLSNLVGSNTWGSSNTTGKLGSLGWYATVSSSTAAGGITYGDLTTQDPYLIKSGIGPNIAASMLYGSGVATLSMPALIVPGPVHVTAGRGLPSGSSTLIQVYFNGASFGSISQTVNAGTVTDNGLSLNDQNSCVHVAYSTHGTLTATDISNLHTRLTTYLTGIGALGPVTHQASATLTANGSMTATAAATRAATNYSTTLPTLNPADKAPALILSNGNLTATGGSGPYGTDAAIVRTTTASPAGLLYYFETLVNSVGGANNQGGVGIANDSSALLGYVGYVSGQSGFVYDAGNAYFAENGTLNATTSTFRPVANDVLMCAFNDTKIWYGKNGTWFNGDDPTILTGGRSHLLGSIAKYAAAHVWGSSSIQTYRFSRASQTYTLAGSVPLSETVWKASGNLIVSATVGSTTSARIEVTWAQFSVPSGPKVLQATANFSAAGNMTANAKLQLNASATLSASGALSAAVSPVRGVSATMSASGTLAGSVTALYAGASTQSASGNMTAAVGAIRDAASTQSASGTMVASAGRSQSVASTLTAAGNLSVDAGRSQPITVIMAGNGNLIADVNRVLSISATLSAAGSMSATAAATLGVTSTLTAFGTLIVDAVLVPGGNVYPISATFTAAGTLVGTAVLNMSGLISEVLFPVDAPSAQAVFSSTRAEAVTAQDTVTSTGVFGVSIAELLSAVDFQSTGSIFNESVNEALSPIDSFSVLATYNASRAETLTPVDAVSSQAQFSSSIAELLSAVDASSAQAVFNSSRGELLSPADFQSAQASFFSSVAEVLNVVDTNDGSVGAVTYSASVSEVLNAVDSVSATGGSDVGGGEVYTVSGEEVSGLFIEPSVSKLKGASRRTN